MARPIKKGLDYFPLDTKLRGKIEYIQCMFGMLGVMVIISLWQRIYENSYYIEYSESSSLVFSKDFGEQLEFLSKNDKKRWEVFDDIVKQAVEYGLFNKDIFEKYGVLTSKSIQENYIKAKEKSAKIEFDKRYLLLSDADFSVSSPKIEVITPKTGVSSPDNATEYSRVEESRVNESTVEEKDDAAAIALFHKYEQLIGIATPAVMEGIDFYIENGVEDSLIVRIIEYACEQGKRNWQYINAAIRGNMDAGIKTLDAYNRAQAERAENAQKAEKANKAIKKSKFNNYIDTNEVSLSPEQILKEMLGEESKE